MLLTQWPYMLRDAYQFDVIEWVREKEGGRNEIKNVVKAEQTGDCYRTWKLYLLKMLK